MDKRFLILLSLILALACSCNKESNCLKSLGELSVEVRYLPDFDRVYMYDNIDVFLLPDDQKRIEVKAGENILDGIATEVKDGELIISNRNKCNWLRDLDPVLEVYIYHDQLRALQLNSTGDVRSLGLLEPDSMQIEVWDGAGSIDVSIQTQRLVLKQHSGAVDFHVSGQTESLTIFSISYGPFYCDELMAQKAEIVHSGTNHCYVNAIQSLDVRISGKGNVYYYGRPEALVWQSTDEGQLIYLGK